MPKGRERSPQGRRTQRSIVVTNNKSVLIGPMIVLAVLTSGAASATVFDHSRTGVQSMARAPQYDAGRWLAQAGRLSGRCTLPAPDLSNLSFWERYTSPGEPHNVMMPRILLVAIDETASTIRCEGLVREKTYVVDVPELSNSRIN